MKHLMTCRALVLGCVISWIGEPVTAGDDPRSEYESLRRWVTDQPSTFDNEVLFSRERDSIFRSTGYAGPSVRFGDFDGDDDVDLHDHKVIEICLRFSGPGLATPPACDVFDSDADDDVDVVDFSVFTTVFTGSLSVVRVEAGNLVPILPSVDGYYSGEPGTSGNNALNGIAAQAGYTQDDLWYEWSVLSKPEGSGDVILSNASRPATAYTVLAPFLHGAYEFQLKVTNLITAEFGMDIAALTVFECLDDADCDDGLFCNGAETCDDETDACDSSGDPCAEGETCNEDTDACDVACTTDVNCDDSDECTTDTCDADGFCANEAVVCDDSLNCTTDTCDAATGCVFTDVVCGDEEFCDEVTGLCASGVPCDTDADCVDDGLFCTGAESCDTVLGVCVSGGDPCVDVLCGGCSVEVCGGCQGTAPTKSVCWEDVGPGTCSCPVGIPIMFTLGVDDLIGTGSNDTFDAPVQFNPPTGTSIPTFQSGDAAAGGDGVDVLNAAFNFLVSAPVISAALNGIETLNLTDFGTVATTLNGTNYAGVTCVNLAYSLNPNPLVVNNLATLANARLANTNSGLNLAFLTPATSAGDDTMNLLLSDVSGGALTVTTGTANGIETMNIDSAGAAANVLAAIVVATGNTLATVNVTGSQALTITTALGATVTTVDASANTGGVNIGLGAANTTFIGGPGDDTIVRGANYTTADTLDGGGGDDTLGGTQGVLGGTTTAQTKVTNFEKLRLSDAHTTVLNVSHFGSINEVILDLGSNAGMIANAASGLAVTIGTRAGALNVGAGTLGVTIAGSGVSDSLTCTLNDAEQAGIVTFSGAETVNLVSNLDLDGSAADSGTAGQNTLLALFLVDTASTEKVVVTGTEQMNLTGAVLADQIDASGFTQPLIMGAACTTSGVSVTGGGGADTLFGSAGADIVNGGAGNDTLNPLAGNDIVTGGAGADTFRQSIAALLGVDRQTITDFDDTVTTGDVFNFNSGIATLTGTNNFVGATSIQTHSTAGALTHLAAAEVVLVTSATVTDFTSANSLTGVNLITAIGGAITGAIVGANDLLFCVADTNGNVGVYYGDSADAGIVAAEITLIAVLQGSDVAVGSMIYNNFSNGA